MLFNVIPKFFLFLLSKSSDARVRFFRRWSLNGVSLPVLPFRATFTLVAGAGKGGKRRRWGGLAWPGKTTDHIIGKEEDKNFSLLSWDWRREERDFQTAAEKTENAAAKTSNNFLSEKKTHTQLYYCFSNVYRKVITNDFCIMIFCNDNWAQMEENFLSRRL